MRPLTVLALGGHQTPLQVTGHIQVQREREERVHLLPHHRVHVEGVAHGVEAQNVRQALEARPAAKTAGQRVVVKRNMSSVSTAPRHRRPVVSDDQYVLSHQ